MKKRLWMIVTAIAAFICAFCLAACGNTGKTDPDEKPGTGNEQGGGNGQGGGGSNEQGGGSGNTGGNEQGGGSGNTGGNEQGGSSGGSGNTSVDETTVTVEDGKVKFLADGGKFTDGTAEMTLTTDADGKVAMTQQPKKDGCAFDGWYNGTTAYDPTAKYEKGIAFKAKYADGASNAVYEALFSTDSVVTIDINMSSAQLVKLNEDYLAYDDKHNGTKSDIYRMADSVTITITNGGKTLAYYYEEVGVRLKGNTSRHVFYHPDPGFFDNAHFKLSFKQTFDDEKDGYKKDELKVWSDKDARKARKKRTLGGMEKIDIKYGKTIDETYSREAYAFKLFREAGVYAPQQSLCAVKALEKDSTYKNMGLYTVHECVDEVFIKRHIEDVKDVGDLYKCSWGNGNGARMTAENLDWIIGVEDTRAGKQYVYDKKTNKKAEDNAMKTFLIAANNNSTDLSTIVDTDYLAKFEAANYLTGNPDCIRNNFNNYYVYFRKSDGKAVIIPYDYDRCFGITHEWDPKEDAMTTATPYTRQTIEGTSQPNPLYRRLICKGAPYGEGSVLMKYRQNLITLSQSDTLKPATFEAYVNNYKNKYSSYITGAIQTNNTQFFDRSESGNRTFADYIAAKLATLNANIDKYRDGDSEEQQPAEDVIKAYINGGNAITLTYDEGYGPGKQWFALGVQLAAGDRITASLNNNDLTFYYIYGSAITDVTTADLKTTRVGHYDIVVKYEDSKWTMYVANKDSNNAGLVTVTDGVYLCGKIDGSTSSFGVTQGFEMEEGFEWGVRQYTITINLKSGDEVRIVNKADNKTCAATEGGSPAPISTESGTDGSDSFRVNADGSYTFFYKPGTNLVWIVKN